MSEKKSNDFWSLVPGGSTEEECLLRFYQQHVESETDEGLRRDRLRLLAQELKDFSPHLYRFMPLPLQQNPELAIATVMGLSRMDNNSDDDDDDDAFVASSLARVCRLCPFIRSHKDSWRLLAQHKHSSRCLIHASPSLLLPSDTAFVMELCVLCAEWISAIPNEFRNDPDFLQEWIVQCPDSCLVLHRIDPSVLCNNPNLLIQSLRLYGKEAAVGMLQLGLPTSLREVWRHRDLVLLYLEKEGCPHEALGVHSDDAELWFTHLRAFQEKEPPVLVWISDRLRSDAEFWMEAARLHWVAPRYIDLLSRAQPWFFDVLLTVVIHHEASCLDKRYFKGYDTISRIPPLPMSSLDVSQEVKSMLGPYDSFASVLCAMHHGKTGEGCLLPLLNIDLIKEHIASYLQMPRGRRLSLLLEARLILNEALSMY